MKNAFLSLALAPFLLLAPPALAKPRPMPGGYQKVAPDAPEALAAVAALRGALERDDATRGLTLGALRKAFRQVVAGTNYRLVCSMSGADGAASTWEFVLWHKLDGEWLLTSSRRLPGRS